MTDIARKDIHIGFDLDGVLIDHTTNKQKIAAQFGVTLTAQQTPSGVFQSHISQDIKTAVESSVYENSDMTQAPALMAGAAEFLERVRLAGISYTLISRRRDHAIAKRLLDHRGLHPYYFQEENTFFVPDKPSKNTKAIEVGVTHYIDDEPDVLEHLTGVAHKFLFDPHSVWPDSTTYVRVTSWQQLSDIFFKTL